MHIARKCAAVSGNDMHANKDLKRVARLLSQYTTVT